jgi:hypothetical protein
MPDLSFDAIAVASGGMLLDPVSLPPQPNRSRNGNTVGTRQFIFIIGPSLRNDFIKYSKGYVKDRVSN